ncbi:glutathione S-transferase [Alkanindiges hydrocarboniclasticus]|jgi:glutathione S-transferase|uniref:glutathione transferase n=1 Tax=Alkanindiges hydrocarboniclasticus TaxID=1907941 RepID=A0A1S8CSS9_9GAMM|nr:glutathione S-transferase [Alkanindiges hydrocarboniclasticus]ONG38699.1 glutathione S-transferase [Alkanindiges hydrocarboniclasticus]
MITLHHLNNSRSQRILWLMEELNIPYQIKFYQRDAKTMLAPPELKAVHPLGKSPVITDDGHPMGHHGQVTLAESAAIIDYLVKTYGNGRLMPANNSPERIRYDYWMHYAEGSAMPPLVMKLIFNQIPKQKMPFFARPIAQKITERVVGTYIDPQLKLHLDYLSNELQPSGWFVGNDFSAADIQLSFPLEAASQRTNLKQQYPKLVDFLKRIHARPAYQRALQKGGAYAYAN